MNCGEVEMAKVSVDGPLPRVRTAGWKAAVAFGGNPVTEKVTCPVKPPCGVSVIGILTSCPACVVGEPEAEATLKSGVLTVSMTALEVLALKLALPE